MVTKKRKNEIYRPVPMEELKNFLFPEDAISEQSLKAISLELESA